MAAEIEATTKLQTRGGKKPRKKTAVRKRYRQELQKKIQQRRRHREVNRQIWARLQALTDKVQSTETTLLQLATGEDKTVRNHPTDQKILEQAMAGRHWVAIGEEAEDNQAKASVGRNVCDGMLFKVALLLNGRRCIALVDSGASQSYVSPELATLAELDCVPSVLHLELADGSKIQATEQAQGVVCNIGETSVRMNFTVTKLLSAVDCVLGMDWLQQWNPVIDWRKQIMYLYVNSHWTQVHGELLGEQHSCGTVKIIEPYMLSDLKNEKEKRNSLHDWTVVKQPKLWNWKNERTAEKKKPNGQKSMVEKEMNEPTIAVTSCEAAKCQSVDKRNEVSKHRVLVSAKTMEKILKTEKVAYIAVFMPNQIQQVGQTTRTRLQQMKEKGPVRKAPPIKETRTKMCKDAPAAVRDQLQQLLHDYEDLFPAQLPKGRPPKRAVEFEINMEEGSTPPNRPPYRLSPKEHEELQAQIDDLLAQGHIRPSSSPYGAPVLFVPKKDGRWRMCVDYRALNRQTVKDRYPLPRIDDLLDRLGKARHFTTLDLATGYHQIAVKEADIPKTAFRTQRGQFEFVVMPFGVTNAPSTFQRMMNQIFKDEMDKFVLGIFGRYPGLLCYSSGAHSAHQRDLG